MARRFTWWEAERELPRLGGLLREALELKDEFRRAEQAVRNIATRIMLMGGISLDRPGAAAARQQRERSAGRLKQALEGIQETGCVVKDLDVGLVDFPTVFRGREVYLCWKLGEPVHRLLARHGGRLRRAKAHRRRFPQEPPGGIRTAERRR